MTTLVGGDASTAVASDEARLLARVCLPTPFQGRVLRIALLDPARTRREWEQWLREGPPPDRALRDRTQPLRRMLPLVDAGLRRAGVTPPEPLRSYLRMAAAHERMRWEATRKICGEVIAALAQDRIEFRVLRGLALAEAVYPSPALRHCHDLDLLLRRQDQRRAEARLRQGGLVSIAAPPGSDGTSRWLRHSSGFPIGLHTRLVRLQPWNWPPASSPDGLEQEAAGHRVWTLPPAEMFANVLVHAVTVGSLHSICWVADAWYLLAVNRELDWDRVIGLTPPLPLWLTLGWLRRELNAPVPLDVLDQLERGARSPGASHRQQAAAAAIMCCRGRPQKLLQAVAGWGERLTWLLRLAFPEPRILRWIEGDEASLPVLYARRLWRFASRSVPARVLDRRETR